MENNFIIRDIDTKRTLVRNNIKQTFKSLNASIIVFHSINFGLGSYYEIYDKKNDEVVYIYN